MRFRFAQSGHVYDVRAKKYQGNTGTLVTTLAPGETAVYAVLPYRVTGLQVQAPERAAAGSDVEFRCEVRGDGKPLGDHVLHVELPTRTDGRRPLREERPCSAGRIARGFRWP